MAKNSVTDWSEAAGDNTDIANINIDEGCAPSDINNAIRTMMAQLKAFFKSTVFRLWDGTDPTKKLAIDLSGLTTGTTRTLTVPDESGGIAIAGGVLHKITNVTTSGTFTFDTKTLKYFVEVQGGGGNGGGVTLADVSAAVAASGGQAGGYRSGFYAKVSADATITIAAVSAVGTGNGANGNNTTFTDGTNTIVANGGAGGTGGANGSAYAGGTSGADGGGGGTGGNVAVITGRPGGAGMSIGSITAGATLGFMMAGAGGDSPFGTGAKSYIVRSSTGTASAGVNGSGYGSGGSGATACLSGSTSGNGGQGAPGIVRVWEYK